MFVVLGGIVAKAALTLERFRFRILAWIWICDRGLFNVKYFLRTSFTTFGESMSFSVMIVSFIIYE